MNNYKSQSSPIYKEPSSGCLWLIVIAIAACVIAAALNSCDPYNKIHTDGGRPPESKKDSANLSDRCTATYPPLPPKLLPGKPRIITTTRIDSSQSKKLRTKIDSLFSIIQGQSELLNQCPNLDSLRTAIINQTLMDCSPIQENDTIYITDTLERRSKEDASLIFSLQKQNATLSEQHISDATKIKDRTNLAWIASGIDVLLFIGLGFSLAKLIQKKANPIG